MTLFYRFTRLVCQATVRTYFRGHYYNAERLPIEGPVILAANHASYLDPPLIGSGLARPVNYLARDTLFTIALFRPILIGLNCVPVNRDGAGAAGLKGILDRLTAGGVILLFPEGTRSRDGKLQAAQAGIGLTVIKSKAPVLPVRVFGTFNAFNRYHNFPRPRPVAVKYGRPIDFSAERAEVRECPKPRVKEIYQQIANRLMAEIAALECHSDPKP